MIFRKANKTCYVYEMVKSQTYAVSSDTLLPLDKESRTRGNSQKLKKQRFNTIIRKKFFSLRITGYWNGLPDDIIQSKSVISDSDFRFSFLSIAYVQFILHW